MTSDSNWPDNPAPMDEDLKEFSDIPLALPADIPLALPADPDEDDYFPPRWKRPPHPGLIFSVLWCIAYLIVAQVIPAAVIAFIVIGVTGFRPGNVQSGMEVVHSDNLTERIMMPALLTAHLVGIAVSLLMIRIFSGVDWKRKIALKQPGLIQTLLVIAMFPALPILASGIFELTKYFLPNTGDIIRQIFHAGQGKGQDVSMESLVDVIRQWSWPVALLTVAVAPGIGEELWCRAFLGRGLVGHYGWIRGIFFTSLLFGMIHIDPQQGFMAMCMGFVLHAVYKFTRSLWIPMLMHFLNNASSVLAPLLGKEAQKIDTAGGSISPFLYIGAACLLATTLWALYKARTRFLNPDGVSFWEPRFPSVEHPPTGLGIQILRPAPNWVASGLVLLGLVTFYGGGYLAINSQSGSDQPHDAITAEDR